MQPWSGARAQPSLKPIVQLCSGQATPSAVSPPKLWLLGSSMYSAHLAAAKGLPYVFAHHFSGQGTEEALATYREEFRPSEFADKPTTFMTVNACVAETRDEAEQLIRPNLQMMAWLRTGEPLRALDLVEDSENNQLTAQQEAIVAAGMERAVVGAPETLDPAELVVPQAPDLDV